MGKGDSLHQLLSVAEHGLPHWRGRSEKGMDAPGASALLPAQVPCGPGVKSGPTELRGIVNGRFIPQSFRVVCCSQFTGTYCVLISWSTRATCVHSPSPVHSLGLKGPDLGRGWRGGGGAAGAHPSDSPLLEWLRPDALLCGVVFSQDSLPWPRLGCMDIQARVYAVFSAQGACATRQDLVLP